MFSYSVVVSLFCSFTICYAKKARRVVCDKRALDEINCLSVETHSTDKCDVCRLSWLKKNFCAWGCFLQGLSRENNLINIKALKAMGNFECLFRRKFSRLFALKTNRGFYEWRLAIFIEHNSIWHASNYAKLRKRANKNIQIAFLPWYQKNLFAVYLQKLVFSASLRVSKLRLA